MYPKRVQKSLGGGGGGAKSLGWRAGQDFVLNSGIGGMCCELRGPWVYYIVNTAIVTAIMPSLNKYCRRGS